jgi:inward rectifier potassium channel
VALSKLNRLSRQNTDTGFGVQPNQLGERFVNKDGSFNLRKEGWPFWKRISLYSGILKLSWLKFLAMIVLFYLTVNLLFTALYLLAGPDQLTGLTATTAFGKAKEIFFFSAQTFTTVGYGRINPISTGADIIASIEAMMGWLFFALVTGLLYGRFTQPKAFLAFSENALISPYRNGRGLMFRMVPYKEHHHLTDARVVVNIALMVTEGGVGEYKFYELKLERSRIDSLNMNWTVVHPIDEESPLLHFTPDDMKAADVELYVQVSGFDPIFSNTVMQRTSYTFLEMIWNAKFKPMYQVSENGVTTIIELNKLNDHEKTDAYAADQDANSIGLKV